MFPIPTATNSETEKMETKGVWRDDWRRRSVSKIDGLKSDGEFELIKLSPAEKARRAKPPSYSLELPANATGREKREHSQRHQARTQQFDRQDDHFTTFNSFSPLANIAD